MMKKIWLLCITLAALTLSVASIAPSTLTLYNRKVNAQFAIDDNSALVTLRQGTSPYPQVSYDAKGRMVMTFSPNLNPDSVDKFWDVLTIFNQGAESYRYQISSDNARVKFFTDGSAAWWSSTGPAQTIVTDAVPATWSILVGVLIDGTGKAGGSTISATVTITAMNP